MLVEYKGKTWTDLDEAIKAFSEPLKIGDLVIWDKPSGHITGYVRGLHSGYAWLFPTNGSSPTYFHTSQKYTFPGYVNNAYYSDILGRLRELKEVENARLEAALKAQLEANARALRDASYIYMSYDIGKYAKFAIGDKVYSKYTPHIVRTITKYNAHRGLYYCDYNLAYSYANSDLISAYELKVGDLVTSVNNTGYTYEVVGLGERPNTYDIQVVDRDFVYKNTEGKILIKVTHQPFGLGRIVKYKNGRDHYRVEGMTTFSDGVTKYALFNLNNRKDYYDVEHKRLVLV